MQEPERGHVFGSRSLADMLQRRLEHEVWCLSTHSPYPLNSTPLLIVTPPTNTANICIVSSASQIHTILSITLPYLDVEPVSVYQADTIEVGGD